MQLKQSVYQSTGKGIQMVTSLRWLSGVIWQFEIRNNLIISSFTHFYSTNTCVGFYEMSKGLCASVWLLSEWAGKIIKFIFM